YWIGTGQCVWPLRHDALGHEWPGHGCRQPHSYRPGHFDRSVSGSQHPRDGARRIPQVSAPRVCQRARRTRHSSPPRPIPFPGDLRLTTRRDFLASTGLAAGALTLASRRLEAAESGSPILTATTEPDPQVRVLLMEALNAAKLAGASWADVRVQRQRRQNLSTREQQEIGRASCRERG